MADNFGVYNITGEIESAPSSTLPGTEDLVRRLEHGTLVTEFAAADLGSYDDVAKALSWAGPGFTDQIGNKGIQIGDVLRWQILQNGVAKDQFFDIIDVGNWQTGFPLVELYIKVKDGYDFSTMTGAVQSGSVFRANRFSEVDDRPTGMNERRKYERGVYDRLIQGKATRFEVAEDPPPGYSSSFSFADPNPTTPFSTMTVGPPSWTQNGIGLRHAYVIPEISASQHEASSLNGFLSGVMAMEDTPVPASGNIFYSKQSRFISKTYALTASALLPVLPAAQDRTPARDEYASRSLFLPGSGSYRNTTIFNPSMFEVDVPDYGRIRDIKVWVEFIHDHRGGPGSGSFAGNPFLAGGTGSAGYYPKQGLQGVQVALRSPNVTFDFAHPLWNEGTVKGFEKWPVSTVNSQYRSVPDLLKSSYLLWAGHSCEEDLGYALGSQTGSNPDYLPSSPFTLRNITSSSIGPGINNAVSDDYTPNYSLFNYFPAFRTISTLPIVGTSMQVLYPTGVPGDPSFNTQIYQYFSDDGTTLNPAPQMFFSSSGGTGFGFYVSAARLRKNNKAAPFVYGSTIYPGVGTNFAVREMGDGNFRPWIHRWPIVVGNTETYGIIPFGADSFYDMAIDQDNNAHFIYYSWRGDLGISIPNYAFLSGAAMTTAYVPPGTIQNNTVPLYPNYTVFVGRKMTTSANISAGLNSTVTVDGVFNYVVGQHIQIHSGGVQETTTINSITDSTHFKADIGTSSYGPLATIYPAAGGTEMWNQSGSLMMLGELDNPVLNGGFDSTPAGSVGAYPQIEVDKNNMLHVVYVDSNNMSVKYAKKPVAYTQWSGSWSFELVFKHAAPSTYPTHLSMDLDSNNDPHIAYSLFDGSTDNIYYAHSGTGGWNLTKVASISGLHLGTRIKLNSQNVPHIVTTLTNFDGSGNEAVVLFTSSSFAGWSRRNLYYDKSDNPRELSINFDVNDLIRVYSGGGNLEGIWETRLPQQGKYNEYNTDIDMRTIFTDSSRNLNPRNIAPLYASPKGDSPGESGIYGTLVVDGHVYPSPFSASIPLLESAGVWGPSVSYVFDPTLEQSEHLTGSNCPWMFDDRVPPGIFKGLGYQATISSSLGLSPPPGWLTGPGGTAKVNEFPTTGSNLGPRDIQPVYPLLDDVYVEKIFDQPLIGSNLQILPSSHKKIIGFRPGLRGTEIHGKWRLLIGVAGDVSGGNVVGNPRAGIWFRQVRIEFLIDQGQPAKFPYASKALRFRKNGVPAREGKRLVALISGSSAWDVGVNYVYSNVPVQHGRSVGITDSTGSADFSVFSQITGSLIDLLSGSGGLTAVRNSYLSNEFGTPYIPISSGSSAIPSFDTFSVTDAAESRDIFSTTLNPKTLIPKDNTLRAHLTRAQVLKTTRDVILAKVSLLKS